MPAGGWILVGLLAVIVCVRWSQRLVAEIASNRHQRRFVTLSWLVAGCMFGGTTGWFIAQTESVAHAVVLTAVALLTAVQTPLDLRTHRLSRSPTVATTMMILATVVIDALVGGTPGLLPETFIAASMVVGVYALVQRASPRSLGWGDVLIVVPLALAVGFIAIDRLLVWQLLATSSGAIHAVSVRLIRKAPNIPFGPHLLIAAWAVLVTSV